MIETDDFFVLTIGKLYVSHLHGGIVTRHLNAAIKLTSESETKKALAKLKKQDWRHEADKKKRPIRAFRVQIQVDELSF